ncbi:hypothetical protein C0Q44_25245 [Paenibacillus sp. PCH8]|nr:hypothetical protein C0Q44_25245 [Paenibacillus sp. PCH8]
MLSPSYVMVLYMHDIQPSITSKFLLGCDAILAYQLIGCTNSHSFSLINILNNMPVFMDNSSGIIHHTLPIIHQSYVHQSYIH